MSSPGFSVAGQVFSFEAALSNLTHYPKLTPPRFDYEGPGAPDFITMAEIKRNPIRQLPDQRG